MRSISRRDILLFFMCWLPALFLNVTAPSFILNGAVVVTFLAAMLVCFRSRHVSHAANLLSMGLLLSAIYYLLLELYSVDPIMVVTRPDWDIAVILAVLVVGMQRGAADQFACLTIGVVLGELSYLYLNRELMPVVLGTPSLLDKWLLAFILARLMTASAEGIWAGFKASTRTWSDRKRGWRK
ncbi:hypothetical protein [Paenibacillus sp. FJAT-26967]|uniref:YphA family membrane protein n=1 Tax=Paenibacillus sp. FJAT-26967 TaxID=1729690 RepID=UPI0020A3F6D9|nr:hypothetical protein [Paenibacillus sp. FJAT-26967]